MSAVLIAQSQILFGIMEHFITDRLMISRCSSTVTNMNNPVSLFFSNANHLRCLIKISYQLIRFVSVGITISQILLEVDCFKCTVAYVNYCSLCGRMSISSQKTFKSSLQRIPRHVYCFLLVK